MPSKFIPRRKRMIPNGYSAKVQLNHILRSYPEAVLLKAKGNSFTVLLKLRPTPISKEYDVQVSFDHDYGVRVNVVNEKLKIAKNRTKLPHVYSHNEQRLCLYSPHKKEWTREKLICSTIIPWASDWLFYYEHWLVDGEWLGGGHDEYPQIEEEIDEREKV